MKINSFFKVFIIVFSLLSLSFINKANAVGCTADCYFSTCTVTGCDMAGCACYFGIASCKCEEKKVKKVKSAITAFSSYANSTNLPGLINLSIILDGMPEDSNAYDQFFITYQNAVNSLTQYELSMLINYLN